MSYSIRILSAQDVEQALPMTQAIAAMKSAYAQLSAGEADMPLRGRVGTENGVSLVMPAYLLQSEALAVKVVSVFPENVYKQQPIIYATVLVLNAETGQPLALMEGSSLTAIRTGAGSGAATDVLAREDARIAAIIGSGVQARTQLEAVCAVRDIQTVYVYSSTRANAESFAATMAGFGTIPTDIRVAESAQAAIRGADIICTATTSHTPVFSGADLKAGVHINAVGSYTPEMQEVDELTLQQALITVDSRESVLAEAGEIMIALQNGSITDIHAEIGAIINGTAEGRTSAEQITYFKSCGVAVQDAAAAHLALMTAERLGLGTVLAM